MKAEHRCADLKLDRLTFRVGGLLSATIQHNAVYILRLQRRVSLREPQRQVVLAVDHRSSADDADQWLRDHSVHQPLRRLRFYRQHDRRPQPNDQHSAVSTWLARTLDRL